MSGCAPRQLTDILKHGSDVHLLFGEEVVPAHSLILKQWSGVLRNALLASSSSSDSITSSESSTRTISECVTTIPMEGTSREDWLVAMEFMYPVVPQPEVTWKDLEVRKPLLLPHCGISAHMLQLTTMHCTVAAAALVVQPGHTVTCYFDCRCCSQWGSNMTCLPY